MSEEHVKSLVPKCYKSILINLSKNVFSLPRKWQDFDFQRFIIKTDYFFHPKCNKTFESIYKLFFILKPLKIHNKVS